MHTCMLAAPAHLAGGVQDGLPQQDVRPHARAGPLQRVEGGVVRQPLGGAGCDVVAHLPQSGVPGRCCKDPLQDLHADKLGAHAYEI